MSQTTRKTYVKFPASAVESISYDSATKKTSVILKGRVNPDYFTVETQILPKLKDTPVQNANPTKMLCPKCRKPGVESTFANSLYCADCNFSWPL
jgi:hypothetical protein